MIRLILSWSISTLPSASKDGVIVSTLKSIIKAILFPLKFIIIWFEGDTRQDSYTRHSIFITKLKISLISLSVAMLIGLIIWPLTADRNLSVERSEDEPTDSRTTMSKPKFYGIDSNNQPYNIIATDAKQQSKDVVLLNEITGNMILKDGVKISISSNSGTFNIVNKNAKLSGNVIINSDNGYKIRTESVNVDVKNNLVRGDHKVTITGLLGKLNSDSFIIKSDTDEIKFYKNVHLIAKPAQKETSRKNKESR